MSTWSRLMRWSSRSNGPAKTAVVTSYGTESTIPASRHATANTLAGHDSGPVGHPAHRRRPARQLRGRDPAMGGRAVRARRPAPRRRPARADDPAGPGRAAVEDAGDGHGAAGLRAR